MFISWFINFKTTTVKEHIKKTREIENTFHRSLNTYEANIQQEQQIFEPNEVDKLKEEFHGLKLENETLKIQAIKREKMIW